MAFLGILLLTQDPDKTDCKFIEDSFNGCYRFGLTTNLAAWATAYVEVNEAIAIDAIEENYLGDPKRTAAEIRAVITALSVHGGNQLHLRDRVTRAYSVALTHHPAFAGEIAKDLRDWQKWEHQDAINQLLTKSGIEFETWKNEAIENYLQANAPQSIAIE